MRGRGSCWGGDEPWQADQIAAGHRQGELEAELSDATEHGSRKPTDRLAPTERLFDPLPLLLAHRVAGMPRGAAVDGRSPATDVLSDMRPYQNPAFGPPEIPEATNHIRNGLSGSVFRQPAKRRR